MTASAVRHRPADLSELPAGAVSGVRAVLPFIDTPRYLQWLQDRCADLGVNFAYRPVRSVAEAAAGGAAVAVVVAAGIRSGELLGDGDTLVPVRGQVLRLANPGLRDWHVDTDHLEGPTYVFPRRHGVVCGGAAWPGEWWMDWNDDAEASILRRVTEAVPVLARAEAIGRSVGPRPPRQTVRI